jgi:hypothetical protein
LSLLHRTPVFSLILVSASGCFYDYYVGDFYTGKPPDMPDAMITLMCPTWTCVEHVTIPTGEYADLATCYSWSSNGGWQGIIPNALSNCNPEDSEPCLVQTRVDLGMDGSTGDCPSDCMVGSPGDVVDDECCYEAGEEVEMAASVNWSDGEDLVEELLDRCGVSAEIEVVCEAEEAEATALSAPQCPVSAVAQTPGADYVVEVEVARSYVTVHTSTGHDTVPLTGMGAVGSGPAEFLSAVVDATQTLDLGSDDYSEWRFWFTADISMNTNASSFVVPHAQGYQIKGRGRDNGYWASAVVLPMANATGQFNAGTGRWQLNYASSFPGGWVQMHLEGPYYGTSSP